MASISITVPDAQVNRVLDAFAGTFDYNADTDGTKAQFARAQVAKFAKDIVKSYEAHIAAETARLDAIEDVETNVSIS